MSTSSSQLLADLARLHIDSGLMHAVIHGDAAATVMTEGGIIRSVANAVNEIAAFTLRGGWEAGTAYNFKDVYTDESGVAYMVLVAHTSTTISADLAAGKVGVYQGIPPSEFTSRIARVVDSISALRGLSKSVYNRAFVTGYYGPGDGGGGAYFKAFDTAPDGWENGGTQIVTADGAGWQMDVIGAICIRQFGAKGDGVDDSNSVVAFFSALRGRKGIITQGHYVCNTAIAFPDGTFLNFEIEAGAILDLSGVVTADAAFTIGTDTGGMTALPTIGTDIKKGDSTFSFASAPALVPGQIYIVWNNTPFSWLNKTDREYYLAGEFCRAMSVTGNTVTNEKRSFDSYKAGSNILASTWATNTVNINGKGKFVFPPNTTAATAQIESGLLLFNGYRSSISGISVQGANRAQIDLRRCFECQVTDITSNDYSADVGLDYIVSMIACWDCHVSDSTMQATRHCVTLTGGTVTGSIPNRFCGVHNCTASSATTHALDMHGSNDWCEFTDNTVYGGVFLGGNNVTLRGGQVFSGYLPMASPAGRCVYFRDPKGCSITIADVELHLLDVVANVNDAPIDLQIAQQYSTATGLLGGKIQISNVSVVSDVAIAGPVAIISLPAISVGNVDLSVEGVEFLCDGSTVSPLFRVDGNAGGYFRSIHIQNLKGVALYINSASAKQTVIDGIDNSESPTHGVFLNFAAAAVPQIFDVKNVTTRLAQQAGILVYGPGKANDVIGSISNCFSINNNQNGTNTTSRYKASIAVENLKEVSVTFNKVGDTQVTPTQIYSFSATNCGIVTEAQNGRLGTAALGHSITGVDTFNQTIAPL
jgi:hypothetical protein